MNTEDFENLKQEYNNFENEADRAVLETDLIFGALFSLEDKLRPGVKTSILFNQKGEIKTRLISGDNKETAKAVAIQAGIVTE
jgi:Ca2+-transporting ATPase